MNPFDIFKRIASLYEGVIDVKENEISITAVNNIAGYTSKNKTEYTLSVRRYMDKGKFNYFLSGHERGNFSGFSESYKEERIKELLDKYAFKKRAYIQTSLFD
jgi:hypothetical protein